MNRAPALPRSAPPHGWARTVRAVLVTYWSVLFLLTHVPGLPDVSTVPNSDKLVHFILFAGLAALFALDTAARHPLTLARLACLLLVLLAYTLFDEFSQGLVGRTVDPRDWLANLAGCLFGLAPFALAALLRRRARSPEPAAGA